MKVDDAEGRIRALIRDVPDFPKPGILFKDITPVLADPGALAAAVAAMAEPFAGKGVDVVVGMESRGFLFGPGVAQLLGAGFAPARKPGKLPWETMSVSYDLEYGTDSLELHRDAARAGSRVLVVDDLLATGGTAEATCKLVAGLGAEVVGLSFLVELEFLKGRERLRGRAVEAVVRY